MTNRVLVFRLPQSEREHQEELAMRARGEEPPVILLGAEDFRKLRRLFDQPPKRPYTDGRPAASDKRLTE